MRLRRSGTLAPMQAPTNYRQLADVAQRRALVIGTVSAVVIGVLLAVLVHLIVGIVALVVLAAGWVLWVQNAFADAEDRVLSPLGAAVPAGDLPGLRNALEGVALLTGVGEPALRLVESSSANAMATASPDGGTVVVTSGLLQGGSAVEAEVLAAELLCRLRNGSARYATLVAGLPALVRLAAGLSDASLATAFGEQWALRTDFEAVNVTRYPPGLIAALERMDAQGTELDDVPLSTAALWIAPALGTEQGVNQSVDRVVNQPIDYRIAALREL